MEYVQILGYPEEDLFTVVKEKNPGIGHLELENCLTGKRLSVSRHEVVAMGTLARMREENEWVRSVLFV
jgi:hypothetical protein